MEMKDVENMFSKVTKVLKSRTVWMAILVILINGVPALQGMIPEGWLSTVNQLLAFLAAYFRITPKQQF